MHFRHMLALGMFAVLLTGCQMVVPPPTRGKSATLDTSFTLGMGQSIALNGEPLTFVLENWVDDRRCPSDATCDESGPVKVQVALWREGRSTAYMTFAVHTDRDGAVLATAPGSKLEGKAGPYRVTITAVTPYPADAQGIAADAYAATFAVSKDPAALLDTDAGLNVIVDMPFTLAPGEQVPLVGRDVALRVDRVTDNRCPGDQECTAADGVALTVDLSWLEGDAPALPIQLTAGTDETGAVLPAVGLLRPSRLFDGVGVRLLRVEPYPSTDQKTEQGDYRVTLTLDAPPRMPNGTYLAAAGEPVTLPPDHTAVIGMDALRVRFDGVVEDSRCPRLVLCVQAGEVQVALTVANSDRRATTYVLGGYTNEQGVLSPASEIAHAGYIVRLEQVTPYPEQAGASIVADSYMATFVVDAPASQPTSTPRPAAAAPAAERLPLLCVNAMAATRVRLTGVEELTIQFTEPLAQDAATGYGEAHALCNDLFGQEWVMGGPADVTDFAAYLPAGMAYWIWDGMAGGLVRPAAPAP